VSRPEAVGGPILTTPVRWILGVFLVGAVFMLWRFIVGLGPTTGLNDGYPWGIWIAFDVVTGTALACGGYAVAILTYVLNKGKYHTLVRSAVLTSALGYSVAAIAIVVDVGRYWYLYKLPVSPHLWNSNSALLEVAICVMSYIVVLWIEMAPVFLDKWKSEGSTSLRRFAERMTPVLDRSLVWILALGLILPTMHQSSLGSVMMIAVSKIDPLWHTGWLPMLFLLTCICMGYSVVVVESTLSSLAFRRPLETKMLGSLARAILVFLGAYFVLRFGELAFRGQLGRVLTQGSLTGFFLLENLLLLIPGLMILSKGVRNDAGKLFLAAFLMLLGGTLYRFNVYLIAFNPGPNWVYFPTAPEMLITFGIVAIEILAYIYFVKRFPILAGRPRGHHMAAAAAGH
jgi:Ni/Fe-hydrogenase subunit HybB-like protein